MKTTDGVQKVGEHDFHNGIMLLKNFLERSPDLRGAQSRAAPEAADRAIATRLDFIPPGISAVSVRSEPAIT